MFAITGPRTFSAGVASVAYLKQAGGKRTVLVGEPPGDGLMWFAEGRPIILPQSKVKMLPATARHEYRDGCRGFDDCFAAVAQPGRPTGSPPEIEAAVVRRPISIESLEPEIAASFTLSMPSWRAAIRRSMPLPQGWPIVRQGRQSMGENPSSVKSERGRSSHLACFFER